MPKYSSRERVNSGVPLGGIGAGKMEIKPTGSINYITFQNNWSEPITGPSGVLGFHFGIFTEQNGIKSAKLLQTDRIDSFPLVKDIEYDGSFPFAALDYKDKEIPLKIGLTAFSSFIPHNKKDSSLPGAFFKFRFKNRTRRRVTASLLAIGRNTVGNWGVGRYNTVSKDKDQVRLTFRNRRRDSMRNDFSLGDMTISVSRDAGEVTYLGEWNLQGRCFRFRECELKLDAWNYFSKRGSLPNRNTRRVVEGESQELGGALAVKFDLGPGEERELTLIYSWFFPIHTVGHFYTRYFKNSIEVSRYMFKERQRLYILTKTWHNKFKKSPLPAWFTDGLLNNLYPLLSSTWYGRDGRFIAYEAPIVCPLMGTLDVAFYGSVPLGLFFPELELSVMEQFAAAQRPDGYIPHDLGRKRIDLPSDGTTYYKWKDLCSKFVLLSYRDYLMTKDKVFLKRVYPKVKRAMEWEFAQDRNRDYLPDNEGQDQTFDVWNFYNTNAYTAGIFLAALLACIRMARLFGDRKNEEKYREWYNKGRKSFEKELWNRDYFVNYAYSSGEHENSCTVAQLTGQWYAHLLGLGYITDRKKVKRAIKAILRLNARNAPYGPVSSVFPNGRVNRANLHSRNVFPGMGYAFASLCIYEGFKKEGLDIVKRVWDNFVHNIKTPWNQPDLVNYRTGRAIFGDYYLRNMVIWAVLLALAKRDPEARRVLKAIVK